MNRKEIIIVGFGLAGLSCGFELADKGYKVTILERESYIGGRTSSWNENGMEVESGLHRFLGFYEELPNLLQRCGVNVNDIVEWINEFEVRLPDGNPGAKYAISPLSKPLQSLADILGQNEFLPPRDKLDLAKFFTNGIKEYKKKPEKLDTYTVTEYAKFHEVSDLAITRILTPLTEGIFFLSPKRYSAFVLFSLIGPYLSRIYKLGEGAFKGGMTEVMMKPLANAIKKREGAIHLNKKVTDLIFDSNDSVTGVIVEGEPKPLVADHVVLATELGATQEILKKQFSNNTLFTDLFSLKTLPAVTVQIELSKPALPTDRVQFSPNTILASYAEQSRSTFKTKRGRLSIILANPEKYIAMPQEQILNDVLSELKRVNIELGKVLNYRVISHPYDFYSLTPGSEKLRPPQNTGIKGLTLAGDYTKQKYTATMEGAVYSGQLAAQNVMQEL
jgi:15-cis-phytoene desaturase